MCGIAGFCRADGLEEGDVTLLQAMTRAIAHRGPDGEGFFTDQQVALGHRRLAIIDLAAGQQPLFSEQRDVVVVFNGEIYNFHALRTELEAKGHVFTTNSDTEVIVHGWQEWGAACVNRFRGMFAFAVWDCNTKELFLARDRLGIKPLYYTLDSSNNLVFASELKALRQFRSLDLTLCDQAVEEYFAYGYVPDPRSIYKNVYKLEPGHCLLFNANAKNVRVEKYWDLPGNDTVVSSFARAQEELVARIQEAIQLRLVSDVPLGAFLSGGVDSSTVVAMMSALDVPAIKTASIGFHEHGFDESDYAAKVATQFACDHSMQRVTPDSLCMIDRLSTLYDEPYADSSALPTYALCEMTRQRVTVALSGDGGDELFAGYRGYGLHLNKEKVRAVCPEFLRTGIFPLLGALYPKADYLPKYLRAKTTLQTLSLSSVDSYAWGSMVSTASDRGTLFSKGFKKKLDGYNAFEVVRKIAANAPVASPLRLAQYIDFKSYLPGDILTKVDRASMAHGLEVRVPLLDHELVEWGFGLPNQHKIRKGEGKYILKKAMNPYLDDSILYRKKQGFSIPIQEWLRGPLYSQLEALSTGAIVASGYVCQKNYSKMLLDFKKGKRDHSALLWSALLFETFLRSDN